MFIASVLAGQLAIRRVRAIVSRGIAVADSAKLELEVLELNGDVV